MEQLHFRHLVGEVLPEKRVKQIAAEYDITDGPNDQGEMYTRPGILQDAFPSPYPNEEGRLLYLCIYPLSTYLFMCSVYLSVYLSLSWGVALDQVSS